MLTSGLSRRRFLVSTGAIVIGQSIGTASATKFELLTISLGEAGFSPEINARLDAAIAEKRVWNIHGVVVMRKGRLVLERYFEGRDRERGRGDLGTVPFNPNVLHDLRSVSKSIVGLLYGIALAQRKVPPPSAPLFQSFPEYADLAANTDRARWTVHHVLTMTMGTDWDETAIPYTDPTNSEIAMDMAPDRYRYILDRPVVMAPGQRWIYNGGATALLGRIIAKGTGMPLHSFARKALFDPIGVGPTAWAADHRGEEFAASGLRMTPRDLARIGQLMLNGGIWDATPIVPRQWVESCISAFVGVDEVRRYGYQWYLGDIAFATPTAPRWGRSRLERFWGAYGNGGQRLFVLPGLDLVVSITAGNYDTPDQWIPPTRVLREVVLASIL